MYRSCAIYRVGSHCFVCTYSIEPSGIRRMNGVLQFDVSDAESAGAAVLRALEVDPPPTGADPPSVLETMLSMTGAPNQTAFYKAASYVSVRLDSEKGYEVVAYARRGRGFSATTDSPRWELSAADVSESRLGEAIMQGLNASWKLSGH